MGGSMTAAALYESQGWGVDTFAEDWKGVEETQQQGTLDGSIVAQAVILYMKDKDRVELSAAKLHAALQDRGEDDLDLKSDKTWPKTGRTLWKKIREVTPLLEAHGIRAYRKNDNRSGRPIILDTDFTDPDPDGDKYAKCTDDNADDNCFADDNADDNFSTSSADTPDTYADSDDNGQNGRYFGDTLGSHTSDSKKKKREGESKPDLSSAPSVMTGGAVAEIFSDPPDWLQRQTEKHLENPAERTLKPLCTAVAYELYKDASRGAEIRPEVERELGRWSR
jgi:hypothetical protein